MRSLGPSLSIAALWAVACAYDEKLCNDGSYDSPGTGLTCKTANWPFVSCQFKLTRRQTSRMHGTPTVEGFHASRLVIGHAPSQPRLPPQLTGEN
jgi:hypothetical protein